MRVVVQHRSRYHYPRPALLGPQLIRLRPADHTRARIESYQLLVEPEHRLHWLRDPHGNRVARVTFKAGQAVSELDVLVELAVEINNQSGIANITCLGDAGARPWAPSP